MGAANAYQAGGGFLEGGRHALEESICMQSTLYRSLLAAKELATQEGVAVPACARPTRPSDPRYGDRWRCHIPQEGVIFSPYVEIFRSSDQGYVYWRTPVLLRAIVSVAMPNKNTTSVKDAPVDAPANRQEYFELLVKKWTAVCAAAVSCGARILAVADVGCGVYANTPEDVGRAFGEVLRGRFADAFDEIH